MQMDAIAPPRIALLIAQEVYRVGSGFAQLQTPVAGVLALAEQLETCGFEVTVFGDEPNRNDPHSLGDLVQAFETFATRAEELKDAIVFFYFAGHGIAHGDDYFMLCESASLQNFRAGGLDLGRVAHRLDRHDDGFTIIVADACRDHAFPTETEQLRRGLAGPAMEEFLSRRRLGLTRGIVAIAAADGEVVLDDAGGIGMSLFTAELIKSLRTPLLPAIAVLLNAREAVSASSRRRQRPAVIPFDGTQETILNQGGSAERALVLAQPRRAAASAPWRKHAGPVVEVVPKGHPSSVARTGRRIVLAVDRPTGWSLNPMSALIGDVARRQDIAATFANILLAGTSPHLTIAEEREARQTLGALIGMLANFRFESLRDLTRLDDVWRYLSDVSGRNDPGNVLDDPIMAIAMMADRLAAISATDSPEYRVLAAFLETKRAGDEPTSIAKRDRIAAAAVRPLREFQQPELRRALSPGNVDLDDVLRDPNIHLVIEHDVAAGPAARAAVNLWLGAVRMKADAIPDRAPVMVAVPFSRHMADLAFQRSNADVF